MVQRRREKETIRGTRPWLASAEKELEGHGNRGVLSQSPGLLQSAHRVGRACGCLPHAQVAGTTQRLRLAVQLMPCIAGGGSWVPLGCGISTKSQLFHVEKVGEGLGMVVGVTVLLTVMRWSLENTLLSAQHKQCSLCLTTATGMVCLLRTYYVPHITRGYHLSPFWHSNQEDIIPRITEKTESPSDFPK